MLGSSTNPSHWIYPVGGQFPQPCHFCHRWPVRSVERFTGPWNSTLKNPIIIVGNKADPVTPFLDASMVAGWLGDSAILVEQDGFGHSSLAQKPTCTQKIVFNFFVNGIRPMGNDTVCAIDPGGPELFPSAKALDIRNAIFCDGNADNSDSQEVNNHRTRNYTTVASSLVAASIFFWYLSVCCF